MLKEYRESPEKFAEMKYALAAHMADPSADDFLGMLFMVDLVEYIGQEKYHHKEDASKSAHHFVTRSQEKRQKSPVSIKKQGSKRKIVPTYGFPRLTKSSKTPKARLISATEAEK